MAVIYKNILIYAQLNTHNGKNAMRLRWMELLPMLGEND